MIVLSILVIALFILFAFLKVTGLIEGGNPREKTFAPQRKNMHPLSHANSMMIQMKTFILSINGNAKT